MTPIVDYLAEEEKRDARKKRINKLLKTLLTKEPIENPFEVGAILQRMRTEAPVGGERKWFTDEMTYFGDELSVRRLRERLAR